MMLIVCEIKTLSYWWNRKHDTDRMAISVSRVLKSQEIGFCKFQYWKSQEIDHLNKCLVKLCRPVVIKVGNLKLLLFQVCCLQSVICWGLTLRSLKWFGIFKAERFSLVYERVHKLFMQLTLCQNLWIL